MENEMNITVEEELSCIGVALLHIYEELRKMTGSTDRNHLVEALEYAKKQYKEEMSAAEESIRPAKE